ncbi:YncE family protein [Dyella psychrodurans]|uniref:YncE family protein n=1 Tax=Dyella psychrodurans TaxID=1927960 RepID=A0A370WZ53_9GAMM|nr:YncE family protein [Dyella psychrodurans]RDS81392.1 YncE family protein [Dyella psychrodurans]
MKRMALVLASLMATSAACMAAAAPSTYGVLQRYVLGGEGKWDYLTFDAGTNRLYIARGNRVMVMDTSSGKLVGEVPGAIGAHRVVLVAQQHRGYVSNGHGNSVMPFDLATLKPQPAIAITGKGPDAMLFDEASGKLWTFNGHSNSASEIDPVTQKEAGSVMLPGKPEFAVTDNHGHIYVNLEDTSKIAEIDAHAGKVIASWSLTPCEGPTGLAIDVKHARLFSACANQHLVVMDANDGHRVAVLPIGNDPDAAGYDARAGVVYSSNADGTLTVIRQDDADHYAVIANVATAKGARTLAVDEGTHHVYLAAPDVAEKGQGASQASFGVLVVGAP